MKSLFNRRNLIGCYLFLLMVGEVGVGFYNGLFTPQGFIVLTGLYLTYFFLIDSLVSRFSLNNLQLVLLNFGLYSVLITGFLHGEIADYVLHPNNSLITTLIRIQSALFPVFAYYLINKLSPNKPLGKGLILPVFLFGTYVVILTPTKQFGLTKLFETIRIAPTTSLIYLVLGVLAIIVAFVLKQQATNHKFEDKYFGVLTALLACGALIPNLVTFLLFMLLMIITGIYYLSRSSFRHSKVN